MFHNHRIRIYSFRRFLLAIGILIGIGFFAWIITRPSTLETAQEQLHNAISYGEIKWAWQEYQSELGDDPEWKEMIDKKLSKISLNDNQKSDLLKWYKVKKQPDPVISPTVSDSRKEQIEQQKITSPIISSDVKNEIATINGSNQTASSIDLARLYIQQGDEKCKAFKAAKTPQLYHIANEYYQYAATLTNTNPKVCE